MPPCSLRPCASRCSQRRRLAAEVVTRLVHVHPFIVFRFPRPGFPPHRRCCGLATARRVCLAPLSKRGSCLRQLPHRTLTRSAPASLCPHATAVASRSLRPRSVSSLRGGGSEVAATASSSTASLRSLVQAHPRAYARPASAKPMARPIMTLRASSSWMAPEVRPTSLPPRGDG